MFGQMVGPGFGVAGDPRALSDAEYQQRMLQQAPMMAQATQNAMYRLFAMQNYRPAAIVPAGWADWYATGDEAV